MLNAALIALTLSAAFTDFRAFRRRVTNRGNISTPVFPFHLADSTAVGMPSSECTGAAVYGTQGETITLTHNSVAYCTKSDGTLVAVAANQPRVVAVGGAQSLFIEAAPTTNLALYSSDLTQAAWTLSNMTASYVAGRHPDPTVSGSTLTATLILATALQAITSASSTKAVSFYIKRRTGTGTISATRDGGSTWIDITASVGASWTRITPTLFSGLGGATITNPSIGIRISVLADAVDVAGFQCESMNSSATTATASSLVETGAATATRGRDRIDVSVPFTPATSNWCMRGKFTPMANWNGQLSSGAGFFSVGYGSNGSTANAWSWFTTNAGLLQTTTKDASNGSKSFAKTSAFTASNGTAHTLLVTHDNATPAEVFKVDGVSVGALTASGAGTGIVGTMPAAMTIGSLGTSINGFQGYISDVMVDNTLAGCN